jgi:hypothetical protein
MADNKKNRGNQDRSLISFRERYEVDYAVKQLQKQTGANRQEAKEALLAAAKQNSPSEGREKIMRAARKKLR